MLVPIDFSPRCAWAARYAASLAPILNSELVFLHVGNRSVSGKLQTFTASIAQATDRFEVIEQGDPAEAIVNFATSNAIDLILMPTHSYGRFRRFLLGSVTAKVLHDATCPVWTGVHPEDAATPERADIKSVLCSAVCHESCIEPIRWAQDLSTLTGSTLNIVHAVEAADESSDNPGEIELRRYLFSRAESMFHPILSPVGISARVLLRGGPIAKVIREQALACRADVVVIGRGHTLAGLGRLRTHAYAIIRESPCPVVSI
jgi:nucleotide-binding universal stress UspA family protein